MTQAAASSSRNGLFVPMPSREEAEELERVLAVAESATMGGVGHAESDLSDLSLIDDHTLALAHDLITMGAGASAQSMMMGNEVAAVSNHLFMDNLSIPQHTIHPGSFHLLASCHVLRFFIVYIFFFYFLDV
jgi:pantothenate synthetase